jgi:hypothetical protein
MPRGGKRDGVSGRAYANRTDLHGQNVVAVQPPNQPGQKMAAQAASGQAYGAASAQLAAQKALPIANQPGPAATLGAGGDQGQGQAQQMQQPSTPLTPLFANTNFPNNPVTDGVPNSPGMSPDVLNTQNVIPLQYQTAKQMIQGFAQSPDASPAVLYLASRINGAF